MVADMAATVAYYRMLERDDDDAAV